MVGDVGGTTSNGAAPAVLLVAEGYATAASLHEATGRPVAVAFDAGNLAHVAKALRKLYSFALLVLCGDDDVQTFARTGNNPAATKPRAIEAHQANEVAAQAAQTTRAGKGRPSPPQCTQRGR